MHWQQHTVARQGLELAVQEHGPQTAPVIIALHGWLDNSASFINLAELLPQFRFLALDFPGHGLSSHRHEQADYAIWNYLADVLAVVEHFACSRFILLGHSMGGAVATLFAALYPQYIERLVLLDAVGPHATAAVDAPAQMLQAMQMLKTRKLNYRHRYPDLAAAVAARANKGLSTAAASLLAGRGVLADKKGYYWQLDARLSMKNMLSLDEEQAESFIRQISCPVLLVAAPAYWVGHRAWFERRLTYFQQLQVHSLDGGHHQHMEAHAGKIAELITAFCTE